MNTFAANDCYQVAKQLTEAQIVRLQKALTAHAEWQSMGGNKNWGHVGDLNKVNADLDNLLTFLGA